MESRKPFLPYGRQHITAEDIEAVIAALQSDWLTQGPTIAAFEAQLAERVGANYAVACANGTAALHIAMMALGIGPGDTVVTTPNTFLADASCARYVGADVRFADIEPDTGNMSADALEVVLAADAARKIKAVIPVNFAGQPVDLARMHALTKAHGAALVSDACHALGATYQHESEVLAVGGGRHADLTVFSFHPVKHVAMGEGGAVTTDDDLLARRLSVVRNHGMVKDGFANQDMAFDSRGEVNPWYYELQDLGLNYRLSDLHAALGLSQLRRLDQSVKARNQIAAWYREELPQQFPDSSVVPLVTRPGVVNAHHLFVVLIDFEAFGVERGELMTELRKVNIGTQVHYIPIHLQPYYRRQCGTEPGDFPRAEAYYRRALSLPMYPEVTHDDVRRVVAELHRILTRTP